MLQPQFLEPIDDPQKIRAEIRSIAPSLVQKVDDPRGVLLVDPRGVRALSGEDSGHEFFSVGVFVVGEGAHVLEEDLPEDNGIGINVGGFFTGVVFENLGEG
jgi:hypothetical protein